MLRRSRENIREQQLIRLDGLVQTDVLAANESGIKLFNEWDSADVEVKDISLIDYIQIRNAILLPHTAGRYAAKQFRKAQMPIVERLVNSYVLLL